MAIYHSIRFREKVQEKLLSVGSVREELGTVERVRPGWSKLYFWNDDYLVSRCVCVCVCVCVYMCVESWHAIKDF